MGRLRSDSPLNANGADGWKADIATDFCASYVIVPPTPEPRQENLNFCGAGCRRRWLLSWRPVGSELIEAPAIGAAVRSALLLQCRSDTLSKSVGAWLKPLDHALILVGKLSWPPRYERLRISRDRLPSLVDR
jgi:hypothetical protein